MTRKTYLEHLSKVPMFEALSKKDLQQLAKLAEDVDIPEGKELVKEGSPGREFFVIAQGKAKVTSKNRTLATLGPGDFFGELALLDGSPRNATVTADTEMEVVVLGQREFLGLLNKVPSLAIKLLKGMASRLRDADAKLKTLN